MSYLARLKQLDGAENFTYSPDPVLPKLTKGGYGGFVSTVQGAYVNISASNETHQVGAGGTAIAQIPAIPVISAKDEQAIRSWLEHIGETDSATIGKVMALCQQDQSARDYFTGRAAEELPKPDTYADDRRTCSQCRSLDGRVCTIASPGGVVSAVKGYAPNRTTLIRCAGFVARGML